jgi:predicted ATPase
MKKILLTAAICFLLGNQKAQACASSEPDYEYFNLFAQEIIHNKEYEPFLLTYSQPFYSTNETKILPDENIESWQKYFDNKLTYEETNALVYTIQRKHFANWAKGNTSHQLFQKLGKNFYTQYREGLQYLAKAKELEPYMRINFMPGENSFYYNDGSKEKNATQLNYTKTIAALQNAYKATTNKEIKLRYAYQIVRFNHYTRNYKQAISAFNTLVSPLQLKSPVYYYALDQMAGAQRGLNMKKEANWNFFQVFMHSRNKKQNAYTSMKLSNNDDFKSLLAMAKTPEEKNMAYFLLAYNDYGNPIPLMEKMLANNANSEILKVLTYLSVLLSTRV